MLETGIATVARRSSLSVSGKNVIVWKYCLLKSNAYLIIMCIFEYVILDLLFFSIFPSRRDHE